MFVLPLSGLLEARATDPQPPANATHRIGLALQLANQLVDHFNSRAKKAVVF